jgi:SMODS-associated and fused to various effectors sensor domain/Cap4 dsDNA endonuclease
MGEQSGPRLQGDRYQHLYSWYVLLQLLDDNSDYEYGYVEHPGAGAADDVTLHPKEETAAPAKYYQIKWHTDHRNGYSFESLTEVMSGTRSLLKKLFDSWKKLRKEKDELEIWLVSNWPALPQDLGSYISDYEFSKDFFNPKTLGRERWRKEINASEEEFNAFCRQLRLRLGFAGMRDFEEVVDDRMRAHKLRFGVNPRAIAIDAIKKIIEKGGESKRITRAVLLKIIDERGLRTRDVATPSVSLWIHGWDKQTYGPPPTVELNWSKFFDWETRSIASQEDWDNELFPQLKAAKERFNQRSDGKFLDLRGKLPLTASLAVGFIYPILAGYRLRVEQPTERGTFLWYSNGVNSSERAFKVVEERDIAEGADLLIAFSVSGNGLRDIRELTNQIQPAVKAMVYLEPDNGASKTAITCNEDVVALAAQAVELIREFRGRYETKTGKTHMIVFSPTSFSLFLGQRLSSMGEIITYERTKDGGYQSSVILKTR